MVFEKVVCSLRNEYHVIYTRKDILFSFFYFIQDSLLPFYRRRTGESRGQAGQQIDLGTIYYAGDEEDEQKLVYFAFHSSLHHTNPL